MPDMLTRAADLTPSSVDLEARTASAVVSTGADVQRYGFRPDDTFGPWIERLDVSGADLTRLIGGPVLLDHAAADANKRVGVVTAARVERGQIVADFKFSARAEVADLLRDLSEGIGGAVSVGYRVDQWDRANA